MLHIMDEETKVISDDFARQLSPETALPVAAIKTLIGVIRRSTNTTIRGMEAELKDAIQLMEDKMETDKTENRFERNKKQNKAYCCTEAEKSFIYVRICSVLHHHSCTAVFGCVMASAVHGYLLCEATSVAANKGALHSQQPKGVCVCH